MSDPRLYPERPFLAASVAVFRDGKVLLAARARPPAAHVFSLPGGVVEAGESLAEAALRELAEEVGVTAAIVGFVDHVEIIERDEEGRTKRHFVVCAHAARWLSGEGTIGDEALEVLWVDPEKVSELKTTPGLDRIIERARDVAEERQSLKVGGRR